MKTYSFSRFLTRVHDEFPGHLGRQPTTGERAYLNAFLRGASLNHKIKAYNDLLFALVIGGMLPSASILVSLARQVPVSEVWNFWMVPPGIISIIFLCRLFTHLFGRYSEEDVQSTLRGLMLMYEKEGNP